MFKADPIQSFEAEVDGDVVVEGVLGVEFVVESFADLELDVLFEPFDVLEQDGVLLLPAFYELFNVVYELKEHIFDANIIL